MLQDHALPCSHSFSEVNREPVAVAKLSRFPNFKLVQIMPFMTDFILTFIKENTVINPDGYLSGLTSKDLECLHNDFRPERFTNNVPSLKSVLAHLIDSGEIITDINGHGKTIWVHVETLNKLEVIK